MTLERRDLVHKDSGWHLLVDVDERIIHITPKRDEVDHEEDPGCVCGPELEIIPEDDGDFLMYIHHPIDGRELRS